MNETMNTHELSFAKINIIKKDIAEFIINNDIEINIEHVIEAEEFLAIHLVAPYSVLFNKKNTYSFNFNAQVVVGTQEQLNAVAILCYTEASRKSSEALISGIPRIVDWNVKIFSARNEALSWLETKQEDVIRF